MSLVHEQAAFLLDVSKLVGKAAELSLLATGGELERTPEIQAERVKSGLDTTMDNAHLRRCAIDLHFFRDAPGKPEWIADAKALEEIGAFWEALDPRNIWGGRGERVDGFRHFERGLGGWPSSANSTLRSVPSLVSTAVVSPDRPATVSMPIEAGSQPVLKRGTGSRGDVLRLQELLVKAGKLDEASGIFDAKTETAVIAFQKANNLVSDGVVGTKSWSVLLSATMGTRDPAPTCWLSDADIDAAAKGLDIDPDSLRAVYKVESNGHGFVDGFPRTLFEGHVFWKRLQAAGIDPRTVVKGNEDIVYPKWTKEFYGKTSAQERDRLRRAEAIHQAAARESASWGLFQIMGYHWKNLGIYDSVDDFTARMERHERDQLEAFCQFVSRTQSQGKTLLDLLKSKDWAAFAYGYNGPAYRKNLYDDKLREAYRAIHASA
jgi:hypothetical protein